MSDALAGLAVWPLRTPTLPPATHTNCYVVGEGRLTVVDPASPWEDPQQELWQALQERQARGEQVERIFLTHHHRDHVGGALALQEQLAAAGHDVPIAAHARNRALLPDLPIDEAIEDEARLSWGGRSLRAVLTPGHAPGHLCLLDEADGWMIAGDMVAGVGTILIDPADGDLGDYLDSLARLRRLSATCLLPAHGPRLPEPESLLSFYIAHRHQRSDQIREALDRLGRRTPAELAPEVYPELPTAAHPLAALQILSHLRWLQGQGLVRADGGAWRTAG